MRSAPGVRSAALASVGILAGDEWDSTMGVEGHQAKDGEDMQVLREVLVLLGIGLIVGVPASAALGRYVSSQLYGVEPHDPWVALSTLAVLGVVSVLAGFVPARRASRINPVVALRCE